MFRRFYEAALAALVFTAAVPLVAATLRWAEPLVFPVIQDVQFTQLDDGSWNVSFNKIRLCDLEALYWFNGATWIRQAFNNQFTRPTGPALIEGWPVAPGTDPATDLAIVRHSCHPLYTVETVFNDPDRP